MNTFLAGKKEFELLPQWDKDEILEFCRIAEEQGLQVSIQLQSSYEEDEDGTEVCEYSLYGCYSMTDQHVGDYYRNGGVWTYTSPEYYL
jgi:hypothetical protein